jgi:hypothetical protein
MFQARTGRKMTPEIPRIYYVLLTSRFFNLMSDSLVFPYDDLANRSFTYVFRNR